MDKRKQPRFQTRFDALYSTGPEEGAGVLVNISYAGARMEGTTLKPKVGTVVRLYVFVQPVSPFQIEGRVARVDARSFAIEYDIDDPEMRRLVDDVASLVTVPGAES